jgi:hypothetical protein
MHSRSHHLAPGEAEVFVAGKVAVGMRMPSSLADSEDRVADGEDDWETVAVSQNAARR